MNAKLELEFEWRIARSGYEISPPGQAAPAGERSAVGRPGPEPLIIPRYRARARELPSDTVGSTELRIAWDVSQIRPIDPAQGWKVVNPIAENAILFSTFANASKSPEGCLWFANRYGLLDGTEAEPLDYWYQEIDRFRFWTDTSKAAGVLSLLGIDGGSQLDIAGIEARLRRARSGRCYALSLQPATLRGAMWLQFAQSLAEGDTLKTCETCGDVFTITGRGRRDTARFCSARCRAKFHRDQKEGGR